MLTRVLDDRMCSVCQISQGMERAPAQDTNERLVSDMIFAVANFIIKVIQARDSLFLRAPATFGFLVGCMQVVGWEH